MVKSRRRSKKTRTTSSSRGRAWTEDEVQQALLDPRAVGVGGFPPIVDEKTWLSVQAKQMVELGPEGYARLQLDILREAFSGYAALLAEHWDETEGAEDQEHDPRNTDEIREGYVKKKVEHADDSLVIELCDAGLALLDAEVLYSNAPIGHRTEAVRLVRQAKHRMDQAALAIYNRNDATSRAMLADWGPDQKH